MKLSIPFQSALAIFVGLALTVALVLTIEISIVTSNNFPVATLQMTRLIWALDVLAVIAGGYVTALMAARSPIKHALAVAALLLPPVAVLSLRSAEPPLEILITCLAFVVCIFLGAIGRDWQRQRSKGVAPQNI